MAEISPKTAAELAKEVYFVQTEARLPFFLARPEFSQQAGSAVAMKATVGSRLINTKDGFGICARGGKNYENDLFIIFRGSTSANYGADWVSNFRLGIEISDTGLPVHIGFNHILGSMLDAIKEFLNANSQVQGTIHCIGHSLGGAVATLAADWVKRNRINPVKLYTFGAPRPGLEMFASRFTDSLGVNNIHRVFHATDPVPMIPMYPFVHAPNPGCGHYLPSSDLICSASAHSMSNYVESVKNANWLSLTSMAPPYDVEDAIKEFLTSKTPVNPADATVWDKLNSCLMWVLSKVLVGLVARIQTVVMGLDTIADKIAWVLRKGIDLSVQAGEWVLHLITKMMQALGMKIAKKVEDLTQAFLRSVLTRVMHRVNQEARKAVQKILGG